MAIVRNHRSYPLDLTGGHVLGPGETANVDISSQHEAGLIDSGALIVVDGSVSPVDPITVADPKGSLLFSQPVAAIGSSGVFRAVSAARIKRAGLSCGIAPAGAALTVEAHVNGQSVATLTIPAGSSADVATALNVQLHPGDKVTAVATSVGTTPAQSVVLQLDLGA